MADVTMGEETGPEKRKSIQSMEIGLSVLNAMVALGRPSGLSHIARASGQSASQAHRYLASFVNAGLVRQDPATALYDLHAGALRLGLAAMARLDMFEQANEVIPALVAATGRTILLAIWSELGPTIVRWYPGTPPVYTRLAIGSHLSLTRSATGHVFLAFQDSTYVADLLRRQRANAAEDMDAIRQTVRRDQIASVDGTLIPGLRALAVPVFNLQNHLVLVVTSIASESFPVAEDVAVRQRLTQAGRDITHRLGGRWPEPR